FRTQRAWLCRRPPPGGRFSNGAAAGVTTAGVAPASRMRGAADRLHPGVLVEFALQKFGPRDFDDYFRLVGDARGMAMITERAIPLDEARRDYDKLLAGNAIHPELGQFKILDAQDGGFVGLAKLEVAAADAETAELGYMIQPAYWGRGSAGRVARLLVAKAQAQP